MAIGPGWLWPAALGANDWIISTASLIVGVAPSGGPRSEIMTAAISGLVGGSMALAAEEFVSVSSQADSGPCLEEDTPARAGVVGYCRESERARGRRPRPLFE